MSRIAQFIIVCSFLLSQGCASIVSGSNQDVSVQSNIDQAIVVVDGQDVGRTDSESPLVVSLSRDEDHEIVISHPDHETVTRHLDSSVNPWVWGNLLFGGIIGVVVDFANGAAYDLGENTIYFKLGRGHGAREFDPDVDRVPADDLPQS